MRRVFWVSVGVGATIYVLRKVGKVNAVAAQFTPAGVSTAVNNLAESLKALTAEFKASMVEHETALTEALLKGEGKAARRTTAREETPWPAEFAAEADSDEYF